MAQTMKTEVKLNSTDIATRLTGWIITEGVEDEVKECFITCTNSVFTDIADLRSGMSISIKRGFTTATDQFVFDGYIDRIDKQGPNITIYGKDKMVDLINASVTYTYDGVSFPSTEAKGSDIAEDLIETYGGMTAEVVDTGTTLTLKKFICNGTDVFSRLIVLAEIYDYQVYYDADDGKVHFEPKGYTTSGTTLYVGGVSNNVSNLPKWIRDNTQTVNQLIVKGAVQEVQDEVYFSGDNSAEQIFTLAKKPITVQVWEDVAGTWTLKTPGVENSTSGDYDYTIDKELKTIECTTNWTPATDTDNVKVVYTNAIPVPIQVEDDVSQDKYGIKKAEKFFSDIQTVSDAEQRGNAWLNKYSEPFTQTMIKPILLVDYEAGQKVEIIDILNNESIELVINQIKKRYPHSGDELQLGDREWKISEWGKFTLERIRRLEEESQKNTDLIIQIKKFENTTYFKRRYSQVLIKSGLGDGFILGSVTKGILGTSMLGDPYLVGMIWGHSIMGIWGTATWGDTGNPELTLRILWKDEKYIEKFIDEDFKDSGTGNWDTANKQLVLT